MKTFTIVTDDNMVIVDGSGREIDCSGLDFHALQWDAVNGIGDIEHRIEVCPTCKGVSKKPNEKITDLTPYQKHLDAWKAIVAKEPDAGTPKSAKDKANAAS